MERRAANSYTTFALVKALSIPRHTLQSWLDLGFITPSIKKAEGIGTKALFTLDDIYVVALFRELLGVGVDRKLASDLIKLTFPDGFSAAIKKEFTYFCWSTVELGGIRGGEGGLRKEDEMPTSQRDGQISSFTISLINIKKRVDSAE